MRKVWLALSLALTLSTPALAADVPLEVALPHPGSAFCLSLTAPGGGQFLLGDPRKGALYLSGGLAGAILGYLAFDWLPPGRSPTPNDTENLLAIGYGAIGFLLVGTLSGIDAALTSADRQGKLEAVLEAKKGAAE